MTRRSLLLRLDSTIGTPMDTRNVVRQYLRLLEKAGLARRWFHDLRHTCASLLLAHGVHPRVIMDVLRHSQISLTMDTHSHVIPALQRDTRMERIFRLSEAPAATL